MLPSSDSPADQQPPRQDAKTTEALPYDDLLEAYSTLQLENSRLVAKVTRLSTEISDLSYGGLTNSHTVSSEPPAAHGSGNSGNARRLGWPVAVYRRLANIGVLRTVYRKLTNAGFRGTIYRLLINSQTASQVLNQPPAAPVPGNSDNTSILGLLLTITSNPEAVVTAIMDLATNVRRDELRFLAAFAVRVTRGHPEMHMRWLRQLRYRKEFDLAIALCNACFEADGDQPLIRLNRGYLLYEAEQYAQAAEDLEIAGENRPNSIEEKLVAASARKRLGQTPRAGQRELIASFFNPADATFPANGFDPVAVKRGLARYGCAWIKGLFNPDDLIGFDRIIATNREGILDVYRELGLPDSFLSVGFPLYFASKQSPAKIKRCFKDSYPALFDPGNMSGVDNRALPKFIFNNLRRTGLNIVIREYLGMERLYVSAAACHIRHMVPQGVRSFGEFHQDNRLYNSDAEILTLWFPFRYQHGPMPSLEFLPIRSDSHFPCISVCGIDNEMFDPEVFWRPDYKLGDAMLLSGFSPHRTYFEPDMTVERTSIDFRFFASPLPEPIFEDM